MREYRTQKAVAFLTEEEEEVFACYDGVVESVYKTIMEGNVVVIKHNDELYSIYKSLFDDTLVEVGDNVIKGDVIGYTSDSMLEEVSEEMHLHLEVEYQDETIDPMVYINNICIMENLYVKTDDIIVLPENGYIKAGYTFLGWATTAEGEVDYIDGANFTMGPNSEYTLYAIWQANTN